MLIQEGANDIGVLVDAATIATNLAGMVRLVTAAGCLPILGNLTPRTDGAFLAGLNPRILDVNARLPAMAIREGAILVDLHSALMFRGDHYSRPHPP